MLAETRYAPAPGGVIAYQTFGDGALHLLVANGFPGHVELAWEQPGMARLLQRFANFARVTAFDRPGVGLSDPPAGDDSLVDRAQDLTALLDHLGADRVSVVSYGEGAFGVLQLAATAPERIESLVLNAPYARLTRCDGYPHGVSDADAEAMAARAERHWGTGKWMIDTLFPTHGDDRLFRARMARLERYAATPTRAAATWRHLATLDARHLLPQIEAPTLIVTRRSNPGHGPGHGAYFADRIRQARLLELPGEVVGTFFDAEPEESDHIQDFLTGSPADPTAVRDIVAILFTDIVGSTATAASVGDRHWHDVLDHHDAVTAGNVNRFGGRVVKTTGDGVLAIFPSASSAVSCALAARDQLAAAGIHTRAGVHVGEVQHRGEDVAGLAVHIAQRVSAQAGEGQVLTSSTAADLLVDDRIELGALGPHSLKGIEREWNLYTAEPAGTTIHRM